MTKQQAVRAFRKWTEKVEADRSLARSIDAGFDGGEFSGPAHDQMQSDDDTRILQQLGITMDDVYGSYADQHAHFMRWA